MSSPFAPHDRLLYRKGLHAYPGPSIVRKAALCGLAIVVGCKEAPPDPAGTAPVVVDVAAPDIPWLADGTPPVAPPSFSCTHGWAEVAHDGFTTCEPYPMDLQSCADHEVHLPGAPGCQPIGHACPEGDWPEDLPETGVVFVRPGVPSGDGSQEAPLASIAEAMISVRQGLADTIALSSGLHQGSFAIDADVEIIGACAEQTHLTDTNCNAEDALVEVSDAQASVSNVSIVDATCIGLRSTGSQVNLDGVAVLNATGHGLWTDGGLEASDVSIRDTNGNALTVQNGTASVRGSALLDSDDWGLRSDGGEVLVEDTVIAGSESVRAQDLGTLTLRRVAIVDSQRAALYAAGQQTLVLDTVRFDGIRLEDTFSRGIELDGQAKLECSQLWMTGFVEGGLIAFEGSGFTPTVDCEDVVIQRGDGEGPVGDPGFGVASWVQADMTLDRIVVQGIHGVALNGQHGGDWTVRDAHIEGTTVEMGSGFGVFADGGIWDLERVVMRENAGGIALLGATGTVIDAVILDSSPNDDAFDGAGLLVDGEATLDARRTAVLGTKGAGVVVLGKSQLTLTDGHVASGGYGPTVGAGAVASNQGRLNLERVSLVDNAGFSLVAEGRSDLELTEVSVRGGESSELGDEGLAL